MEKQPLLYLNQDSLCFETLEFDSSILQNFVTKIEPPDEREVARLEEYLALYKENKAHILAQSKLGSLKLILNTCVLQLPTLYMFEDIWGPDQTERRKYCIQLEKHNPQAHKVFGHNKFYNDKIRFIPHLVKGAHLNGPVAELNSEISLMADLTTPEGLIEYESWSFDQKRIFVSKMTQLSFKIMESVFGSCSVSLID